MRDAALISLIHDRYAAVHGALSASDDSTYLTIGAPDLPQATLGYRLAAGDALFLEASLDRPIETVLTEAFGRPIPRARIVELGDHASRRASATLTLWREAPRRLPGRRMSRS